MNCHLFVDYVKICSDNLLQGPSSAVGSESDSRFRDCKFDPVPVPYFNGE